MEESMNLWLPLYVLLKGLIVAAFMRILPRAGFPGWIAIFAVVPFVPVLFLWQLALMRWPGDPESDTEKHSSTPNTDIGRYI
jgi:hypothetical protein